MKHIAVACALIFAATIGAQADSVDKSLTPSASLKRSAKELFSRAAGPADLQSAAVGSYSKGCLAGAVQLAPEGPAWQVMRLSRRRNWGHPSLINYLQKLAKDAKAMDTWPGLLVGDMSQARGGPALSGHRSHQSGLEADIWLLAAPQQKMSRPTRERIKPVSVVLNRSRVHPGEWGDSHARLLRRAASYPEVSRIFVNPPIKKALCEWAAEDKQAKDWLRKIRPWYGNKTEFHVRLRCPAGSPQCRGQEPPESGDGCDADLDWWMSDAPYAPAKLAASSRRPLRIRDLPRECQSVISSR